MNTVPNPADLQHLDLFTDLPEAALAAIAREARVRKLPKGTVIFTQGRRAGFCHALIKGRVRISQADGTGAQLLVRFIGPGDMFGTMALFTDGRYPAEAVTVLDSVEVSWSEAALRNLMRVYPQIGLNIIGILGARIREVQERLREMSTQRVECRIANALLRLAERAGQPVAGGTAISFPVMRRDLAEMCGATLHTVSRVLTAWQKRKLLTTTRQHLTIRRMATLREIALHQLVE
ncbi:MAG: Crp/Fnr family transcriptional regulator [Rhodospirillaceae bacterium]|nr:Crp/Fnr family transcriptional regulator [Rhodospirillaceae bacterium]